MSDYLPSWATQLVIVGLIVLVGLLVQWLLQRLIRRWAAMSPEDTADLVRARRRETAVHVLSSAVRYVVIALTAFFLIGFLLRGFLTAAVGATLVVAVLAFGAQRFFQDIIAGFFTLLENQYGVGDFIAVEPSGLTGVVEDFGLRTTVLRNLNGDRYIIPNGQITGVRRTTRRFRSFTIDLLTHEPDDVAAAVREIAAVAPVGSARFLRPPTIAGEHDLGDGLTLVRLRADVPPTMEWLVEDYLAGAIASRLEGSLAARPLVYALDESAIRRYERTVLL